MNRWWGKPVHRLHLLYEDDSGPPSVDYWGVHTLVVDDRRLSDSLVGYTCTPRDFVALWWGKPVHLCQLTSLEECSSQGFVRVKRSSACGCQARVNDVKKHFYL